MKPDVALAVPSRVLKCCHLCDCTRGHLLLLLLLLLPMMRILLFLCMHTG